MRRGCSSVVYDVDKYGVPDHLGVLGHFKAVVWYLGDNRLTQDPRDEETEIFGDNYPDAAVAKRAQDLTMSVRDYLNEGGKLVHTGETAQYYGILEGNIGGIYYGLNGDPSADCVVVSSFDECLFLADDFSQYYLGAYSRAPVELPTSVLGSGRLAGVTGAFGGPAVADNPLDEAGTFTPTSAVLPPDEYPQFASAPAAAYQGISGGAYDPVEGNWYAGAIHIDDSYARLARTVDLTGVQASAVPTLQMQLSYNTEPGYDHVILEAHTVGADDWTTLPEVGGAHLDRRARGLRPGLPARRASLPGALSHPRRPVRRDRQHRRVELVHRRLRRMAAGRLRPVRLRRQAGRGIDHLRHRSVVRRCRGVRGRHQGGRRRRDAGRRRIRSRTRSVVGATSAGGQLSGWIVLRPVAGAAGGGRQHPGHGAVRVRDRATGNSGRAGRRARARRCGR